MAGLLLSSPGAAQGCWSRVSETKHDASEAEGPSSEEKRKGSSHSGRGRGKGEGEGRGGITHPLVCIESDKVQKFLRGSRCDATGYMGWKSRQGRDRVAIGQDARGRTSPF